MEKDVIIGGASGYDWNQIKPWVQSIKETGFVGDIVLSVTNVSHKTIQSCVDAGVVVNAYGDRTDEGFKTKSPRTAPHVERMFYTWKWLAENEYRYVVFTDVRDVIFQRNPIPYLLSNLGEARIIAACEGLRYKDEPWGDQNLLETFGPFFHEAMRDQFIYNVGTIAGTYVYVRDLILLTFQQSINRPIPIVDQAVFNFLINNQPFRGVLLKSAVDEPWAAQLGTTEEAIKSGAGMIGEAYLKNASAIVEYALNYEGEQPIFAEDGTVSTQEGVPYVIVHQWDRVPDLKAKIEAKYAA